MLRRNLFRLVSWMKTKQNHILFRSKKYKKFPRTRANNNRKKIRKNVGAANMAFNS